VNYSHTPPGLIYPKRLWAEMGKGAFDLFPPLEDGIGGRDYSCYFCAFLFTPFSGTEITGLLGRIPPNKN